MATKKAGGTAKNLTDSNPQYLGIKLYGGEKAYAGSIIVRQRGTRVLPGRNVKMGKDHTIYSITEGIVEFGNKRKVNFDSSTTVKKIVNVVNASTPKKLAANAPKAKTSKAAVAKPAAAKAK